MTTLRLQNLESTMWQNMDADILKRYPKQIAIRKHSQRYNKIWKTKHYNWTKIYQNIAKDIPKYGQSYTTKMAKIYQKIDKGIPKILTKIYQNMNTDMLKR